MYSEKQRIGIIVLTPIIIFLICFLLMTIFKSCACSEGKLIEQALQPSTTLRIQNINYHQKRESDTSLVSVPLASIQLSKNTLPVRYVYKNEVDTSIRLQLQRTIDSLKCVLYSSKTWTLDTINILTSDTVHVECEELQQRISLILKPAPRAVERITNTITNEITVHSIRTFGLGIHAGVGVNTDTKILPVLSFGFNYILF